MSPNLPSILHAIDTTGPGGAETVFLDLAQHLCIDNYRNIALIKGPGWVEDQLIARKIPYLIVKPRGFLSLPYYGELIKLVRKHNVKLVQANLLGSTLTFAIVCLLMRIPLVATLHGRVDINPNERFVWLKNLLISLGVTKMVAVSKDLANYIEARKLFNKQNIAIIYNGINIEQYGKSTQPVLRQKLHLGTDAILVGSLGNVRPAKAYDVLISAAKIVIDGNPRVHFVIAGHQKQDLMAKLQQQMENLQVTANIHFVGFQNNTPEFLSQLNLFALSSSSEGFSIATIEALASSLPVVATRCGGPEEILSHNRNGLLVAANSPEELANGIVQLIENSAKSQTLAEQGLLHVQENFSAQSMLEAYQNIYRSLMPILKPFQGST